MLLDPQQQIFAIVPRCVHRAADPIGLYRGRLAGQQHGHCVVGAGGHPLIDLAGLQPDGHAVVYVGRHAAAVPGDDGEGSQVAVGQQRVGVLP